MTSAQERTPARVIDLVATVVLAGLGFAAGVFVGFLFLVFTPTQSWWPVWVIACIGMMVAPLVTLIAGIVRLRRGRLAFWVPLVGIAVAALLLVLTFVLGSSIQPVLAPSQAPLTN